MPETLPIIDSAAQDVIARVPAWNGATSITLAEQKGGKTNRNYLVTVDGERFVLRISGDNIGPLGINRNTERDATLAASGIGVAPEVLAYLLPEGHLVTRFIEGKEWSEDDLRQPETIRRVAAALKRIHALPAIAGRFDPYRDIEYRLEIARSRSLTLPPQLNVFLRKLSEIQHIREAALAGEYSLCHNDSWHNNFLDDGTVRLLDWEFAGMGDPFFDLASVTGIFSAEQKKYFLECYFGEATPEALHALEQMLFVAVFWNATWALLQIGITYTEHDYAVMAAQMFDYMEQHLS